MIHQRVKKTEAGVTTYYVRSSVLSGQVVADVAAFGKFLCGYVYDGGGVLLAVQQASSVPFVHQETNGRWKTKEAMQAASEPLVSNTSPLRAPQVCGQIELLWALHPRVVVSQAVITELERGQAGVNPLAMDTQRPAWLEVVALRDYPSI